MEFEGYTYPVNSNPCFKIGLKSLLFLYRFGFFK